MITSTVGVIMVLAGVSAFFFFLEKKTQLRFFNYFPPLIFIYAIPIFLSNFGLIPNRSPVYDFMGDNLLPMFLTIMLLNVDIMATIRVMGKGVFVMLLGTVGVMIGAPIAYFIVKSGLGPDTWKGFGALAGSWIGGTGNMFAVAQMVGLSDDSIIYGYAMIADNAVYLIWLPIMLASKNLASLFARFNRVPEERLEKMERAARELIVDKGDMQMRHFLYLIFFGMAVTFISTTLSTRIPIVETDDHITIASQNAVIDSGGISINVSVAENIDVLSAKTAVATAGNETVYKTVVKTPDSRRIIINTTAIPEPTAPVGEIPTAFAVHPGEGGTVIALTIEAPENTAVSAVTAVPGKTIIISDKTYKIFLVTIFGVLLSFTRASKIPGSHAFSMAMAYMFVAQMGARADLSGLSFEVFWFLLGAYIWIFIHGGILLAAARLFRVDVHTAAIASAANIGGAASAPIVAAYHNRTLVPVSVLMAMIGYAIGNPAAFVTAMLCRWVS